MAYVKPSMSLIDPVQALMAGCSCACGALAGSGGGGGEDKPE
ncbi:hypothetical protein [Brevibacillus dissolubilis]|nr:hypothetical protein [Brevibacillus dissolubilis]